MNNIINDKAEIMDLVSAVLIDPAVELFRSQKAAIKATIQCSNGKISEEQAKLIVNTALEKLGEALMAYDAKHNECEAKGINFEAELDKEIDERNSKLSPEEKAKLDNRIRTFNETRYLLDQHRKS